MPNPFPNANYPTAYPEANFLKTGAAVVNEGGVGVDEIQRLFNDATGGDFTLSFGGQTTLALNFNASADAAIAAAGSLTMDVIPKDGDTVTVDAKVYTFQTTLTDVNGNVAIGGTLAQAQLNLIAALDLTGVAGTDYALSMTAHPSVNGAAFATDVAVLTAKVAGSLGNAIATTETFTDATNIFDATTLGTTTLGVDSIEVGLEALSTITDVEVTGAGTSANPWIVTFVDPGDEDVALLTATDTGLTGGTVGTTIQNVVAGSEPLVVADVAAGQGPL